jgi:hypothetical protein
MLKSCIKRTTSIFYFLFLRKYINPIAHVSERKKLCWWSSSCIVETSLTLAKPPSTLVWWFKEATIDSPTSKYHGSGKNILLGHTGTYKMKKNSGNKY